MKKIVVDYRKTWTGDCVEKNDVHAYILSTGEVVCVEKVCPRCKGKPEKARLTQTIEKGWTWINPAKCGRCSGSGKVYEKVEA